MENRLNITENKVFQKKKAKETDIVQTSEMVAEIPGMCKKPTEPVCFLKSKFQITIKAYAF